MGLSLSEGRDSNGGESERADLWSVVEHELVAIERFAHFAFHRQPLLKYEVHGFVIEL